MKGTNFNNCENNLELFHMNRLVQTKIKQTLGRVGYQVLRDGSLNIQGPNKPDLSNTETVKVFENIESSYKQEP